MAGVGEELRNCSLCFSLICFLYPRAEYELMECLAAPGLAVREDDPSFLKRDIC